MENLGLFAIWLLIAAWFLTAIIWFAVAEIKENKRRKKEEKEKHNKGEPQ